MKLAVLSAVAVAVLVLSGCASGGSPATPVLPVARRSGPMDFGSPAPATAPAAPPTVMPVADHRCDGLVPSVADERLPIAMDVSFIDPDHGWALALGSYYGIAQTSVSCAWLGATSDGGATWEKLPDPRIFLSAEDEDGVSHLTFVDERHGFLWGNAFYTTSDGGKTWQRDRSVGKVAVLEVEGTNAWRASVDGGLEFSDDFGASWIPLTPPWRAGVKPTQLVRIDASRAFAVGSGAATSIAAISRTSDGGRTWEVVDLDAMLRSSSLNLTAGPDGKLWLLTGSVRSAGQQAKSVYGSGDLGSSWTLVADTRIPGNTQFNNLPGSGYANGIRVTAAGTLFMALGRGTLYVSMDSGATWRPSIPYQLANPADSGVSTPVFVDGLHGWDVTQPGIFRTDDGGLTWDLVKLPGAK